MENNLNVYIAADNIISSLGFTTQEVVEAILANKSGIKEDTSCMLANHPIHIAKICNSKLTEHVNNQKLNSYSKAEQLIILSVNNLLKSYNVNLNSPQSALIISTTKGNIDELDTNINNINKSSFLWHTSQKIADYYNLNDRVFTLSNACISGVSSLIVARRLLKKGIYKNIVVVGVDILSSFITSGFMSFKSISQNICKPYDLNRDGLNLGEACGSVLLTTNYCPNTVILQGGAITNDANHISGPSRTGNGLFYAIEQSINEANLSPHDIDCINLHGTATIYNDEMEAKALYCAQLEHKPSNSFKSYLGHTLGASGIVETILCNYQLKNNIVFGTFGYENNGLSQELNISVQHKSIALKNCLKTASGFGGCNAAIVLSTTSDSNIIKKKENPKNYLVKKTCSIKNGAIIINDKVELVSDTEDFHTFIRFAYKALGENYMKFYKMDDLCKLGYIAATYLLKDIEFKPHEMGIILANSSSSLDSDLKHQSSIINNKDEGASPATFVYTLPNIVAGEICIRHKIQGENTFFIEQNYTKNKLKRYAHIAMQYSNLKYCIIGWCDYLNNNYDADFDLLHLT